MISCRLYSGRITLQRRACRELLFVILLWLCSGCTNTLVKQYLTIDSKWAFYVGDYRIELVLQAVRAGIDHGTDLYNLNLMVESPARYDTAGGKEGTPLLQIDSVTIYLPAVRKTISPELIPWGTGQVHVSTTLPDGRLVDRVRAKEILIQDQYDAIEFSFVIFILDREGGTPGERQFVQETLLRKTSQQRYKIFHEANALQSR